jgi:hypothetical protein
VPGIEGRECRARLVDEPRESWTFLNPGHWHDPEDRMEGSLSLVEALAHVLDALEFNRAVAIERRRADLQTAPTGR